jgi:hypothetical protein
MELALIVRLQDGTRGVWRRDHNVTSDPLSEIPPKPKRTVKKEARWIGDDAKYFSGCISSVARTFLIPTNATNIRCLYDIEEDQ